MRSRKTEQPAVIAGSQLRLQRASQDLWDGRKKILPCIPKRRETIQMPVESAHRAILTDKDAFAHIADAAAHIVHNQAISCLRGRQQTRFCKPVL